MKDLRSFIAPFLILTFLINTSETVPLAQAQEIRLPVPGVMVHISPAFDPPVLKGITVYPHDPFKFDFILDKGDGAADLKQESKKLVKYFLASITTPENDLWVNLSPYEKNRIIPDSFGQTDMGRDLLAEDYILKQITASLIYPEGETGRKFWKRVYQEAAKRYGTTDIPVNTFNKVWIVPGHAKVYVHGNTAFMVQASLKVMLEQDYLALSKNSPSLVRSGRRGGLNAIGSQIVREIVIPELTKEVNEGKNFAPLRQVYDSLILAVWFKKYMKESVLGRQYMDQNKVSGIQLQQQAVNVGFIYQRYLKAFKKGVYNYIKEEPNPVTREMMPRKYFSGGWVGAFKAEDIDFARTVNPSEIPNSDYADVAVDLDSAMIAPRSIEYMAILVSDLFRYMAPTGTSGSIIPKMILSIGQNLKREFNSMPISDNSKFKSFIYKGQGVEATIFVDPDPQRDDPNNYYKIFNDESSELGLRELSYLKVLKGTPGVPQYLDWGRIGARGIWIHMEGIQHASSITVSDGKGHLIYSEIWKKISPSQRRIALAEAAETLDHVHHRFGFGHGDVKPGNIIIGFDGKKVKIKLIDWGLAKLFDGYLFGKTKGFIAPEWIMHEQTDTYALGETILESLELEGVPSAPLKELCERMKSSFADDRPSLTEVAQKLREFAQEDVDKAMYSSPVINEQKVIELLGELWPEFVEMVHSNKGKLDDWIKDAIQKGEEVKNGYGQNGEPEIIVKDGYADSLQFGIFYKGISIVDIKLVVKQGYGGLDLVYLNPVLRGNRWGPRFALKAIQYFKKFGKDKMHILISEYGGTYWRDKIKLERTVGDIYPIDAVQKKIEGYLKDNAQVSTDPKVISILDGIEIKLHNKFLGIIDGRHTRKLPEFGPQIGYGWQADIYNDPNPQHQGLFYKVFKRKREIGMREIRNLTALKGIEGVPQILDDDWGLDQMGDVWIHLQGIKRAASIEVRNENGDLRFSQAWNNLSFSRKLNILSKVAQILAAAHQAGISHNDINPENIIFNGQGNVMVIDWANAKALGEAQISGNGQFSAPEEKKQDQSDVYSLGMMMYYSIPMIFKDTEMMNALRDLCSHMIIKDFPDQRWTMAKVSDSMKILARRAAADHAMEAEQAPGGIDMTAKRMRLEVESDKAADDQSTDRKVLENIEINGIYIKDIEIKPLKNLPAMLGIPAS